MLALVLNNPRKLNKEKLNNEKQQRVNMMYKIQRSFKISLGYLMINPFLYKWTVLFQTIQFSISIQFSSIWPIDRNLSDATSPGQSGSGSNGNKVVLCVPQSSSITGASRSDCLVSYLGHSLEGLILMQRSSRCILRPQPSGPPGHS